MFLRVLLSAILLLCLIPYATAQTTVGRISGTVTDPTGAVIPRASIEVINEDTGIVSRVATDAKGYFVAPNLAVGSYTVQAAAPGFRAARKTGFALVSDGRLTADFVLAVGNKTETVEVTAVAGEAVNTTSGEVARVIDSAQIDATPLNGRNYMQLVTLIPGVAVLDEDQMAVTTSLGADNQSINGNRSNTNGVTVDGAFNLDAGNNSKQVNNVGVDFIKEVKVQTSNFSAEYGRMSGASINVVTRSGENKYHGSLFEYVRNDMLDAKNYFTPSNQNEMLKFNNFGWSFGGPVKKDKLFFFAGQEYKIIRRTSLPVLMSIPTVAQRAGDFSQTSSSLKLYYPGTKTAVPNKNIAQAGLITSDGKAIADVYNWLEKQAVSYTEPLDSKGYQSSGKATFAGFNPFNSREDLVRIDYQLSQRHSFYGRWVKDTYHLTDPFGGSSDKLPVTATTEDRPGSSAQLGHTVVFSPTKINEARVNAMWMDDHMVPTGDSWKRSTYGFNPLKYYPGGGAFADGLPNIQPNGYSYFGGPVGASLAALTDISFTDNFTWVRGPHTFKTGVLIDRVRRDQDGKAQYFGQAKMNTKASCSTGQTFADALVGCFQQYTEANADPYGFMRFTQLEAYGMDSWKVARRLSVEAGVRFYYIQPAYAAANNLVNFDPSLYDPSKAVIVNPDGTLVPNSGNIYNGLVRAGNGIPADQLSRVPAATSADVLSLPAGTPPGFYNTHPAFAPRVGFSYAPYETTTIRGGFGIYYNRPETSVISSTLNTPPFVQTIQLVNGYLSNLGGAGVSAPASMGNIYAIDPNLKNSYTMNFSLGVQHELPRGVFFEVDYVGNLGRHLIRRPDINTPSFADYQILAADKTLNVNAYRPYKGYSSIYMQTSDTNSNYNALQAYVTKRKGDLMLTASYTWSRAMADTSTDTDNPEDPYNRHFNYGPTSYDRRQVFVANFNYSEPLFRNRHGLLGTTLGGWELGGVVRAQSGPELSVTEDGITGTMRADMVPGQTVDLPSDQRTPTQWFNTAAFVSSPSTRRGNSPAGVVVGPGIYTWDTSLRKNFHLNERFNLRFQTDVTNLLNHPNFRHLNTKVSSAGKTPGFGWVDQAGPARQLQFGLKLMF